MNLKEIARIAGVSVATVSRVLNDSEKVTEKTRQRVLRVVEENSYIQNVNAKNLRTSRTKSIGFLISNLSNPFFIEVYRGLEPVCRKRGYNIVVGNTNEDVAQEKAAIDLFLGYRVDGIIASFVKPEISTLDKIRAFNIKFLLLDRFIPGCNADAILIDNIDGAIKQVDYLAALGHSRIGVIRGTDFESNGIERMEGYMRGMKSHGFEIREEYIMNGQFLEDAAYSATVNLMNLVNPPTAIITHNNLMCMGAYKALKDMRKRIPEDVSLVGFDNFDLSDYLNPSITLIDRPIYEMGETAGNILLDRIEGKYTGKPRKIVYPVKLKMGTSCRVIAEG